MFFHTSKLNPTKKQEKVQWVEAIDNNLKNIHMIKECFVMLDRSELVDTSVNQNCVQKTKARFGSRMRKMNYYKMCCCVNKKA